MSYLSKNETLTSEVDSSIKPKTRGLHRRQRENSDIYFMLLFWLFLCVKLRYDLYITIPVIVTTWKLMKLLICSLINIIIKSENIKYFYNRFSKWLESRRKVIAPKPFIILMKFFVKGDLKINQLLQKSMDNITSAIIIMALILFVLVSLILLAMQVQSESLQFISIVSNILNENLYAKPELKEWLPEKEKLDKLYHATMNNFYLYGREWLSKLLKSSSSSMNDSTSGSIVNDIRNKSEYMIIEAQILEQWDSLYAYLSRKAENSLSLFNSSLINKTTITDAPPLSVPPKSVVIEQIGQGSRTISTQTDDSKKSVWYSMLLDGRRFDYKQLAFIFKDNLGILKSVLDSLYLIIKGNLNLLSTILYTVVSSIFSGGFALVNFFFSFIVYITAVFYLLSMSSTRFKPLQWLTEISFLKTKNISSNTGFAQYSSSYSQLISSAIEDSIRSVFVASLKMSFFYGIYTYLICCLFSVSIIYLPSIMAALFAFLPLLGKLTFSYSF